MTPHNGKLIFIGKDDHLNLSNLRQSQRDFVNSTKLHTGIVGGYQSGKSLPACVKTITQLLQNPGMPVAYYLPTYGLIEDMLIPKFSQLLDDIETPFRYNAKNSKIITEYGEIWMRSMDNPDRIVSYSVGYSLVDEVDVVHPNKRNAVMKRISGRNSYKKSTPNSIDFVSTPEGFGYMYNFFKKKASDNKILYRLSTLDNIKNLGEGYIEGLEGQYDYDQLRAYLHGEFVNLTSGTVHKNFDRTLNYSNSRIEPGEVLHLGMDFNITNMNAVIHTINGSPTAVEEITGAYDTPAMIRIIKDRYTDHSIVVYPDASGKNRSTSGKSDIDLLKQAGFIIRRGAKNPFVRDRINAMNKAFMDADGKRYYKVNTDNCPVYTEALEQQGYRNGEPDKTTGFDHITEAGGYFIYNRNKKRAKVY